MDTYLRLDQDMADLLKTLKQSLGKENVLIFLTADHGVVSVPNTLIEKRIPAGYFVVHKIQESLEAHLTSRYGTGEWIKRYSNQQFFLNQELILEKQIHKAEIEKVCADFLISKRGIKNTFTATQLHQQEYNNGIHALVQRGFNQKRSGDVIINLEKVDGLNGEALLEQPTDLVIATTPMCPYFFGEKHPT